MEFLNSLVDLIASAEFYALIGTLTALLVALGKAFQALGNLRDRKNMGLSGKALWAAGELGRLAEWLAPGNANEKNHPDTVKTALYWVKNTLDRLKK